MERVLQMTALYWWKVIIFSWPQILWRSQEVLAMKMTAAGYLEKLPGIVRKDNEDKVEKTKAELQTVEQATEYFWRLLANSS